VYAFLFPFRWCIGPDIFRIKLAKENAASHGAIPSFSGFFLIVFFFPVLLEDKETSRWIVDPCFCLALGLVCPRSFFFPKVKKPWGAGEAVFFLFPFCPIWGRSAVPYRVLHSFHRDNRPFTFPVSLSPLTRPPPSSFFDIRLQGFESVSRIEPFFHFLVIRLASANPSKIAHQSSPPQFFFLWSSF